MQFSPNLHIPVIKNLHFILLVFLGFFLEIGDASVPMDLFKSKKTTTHQNVIKLDPQFKQCVFQRSHHLFWCRLLSLIECSLYFLYLAKDLPSFYITNTPSLATRIANFMVPEWQNSRAATVEWENAIENEVYGCWPAKSRRRYTDFLGVTTTSVRIDKVILR